MRYIIVVIFSFLMSSTYAGDFVVFKTLEDFKANKGTDLGNLKNMGGGSGNNFYVLEKDGKKQTIRGKAMWGFLYKDELYRVMDKVNYAMKVMKVGDFIYYENGYAHILMAFKGEQSAEMNSGYQSYISLTIDSDMIPIHTWKGAMKKFMKQNPQFSEFYDCIGKNGKTGDGTHVATFRNCLQ